MLNKITKIMLIIGMVFSYTSLSENPDEVQEPENEFNNKGVVDKITITPNSYFIMILLK